ncbi:MAG TPA: site-specific integrase, partial [Microthrixaceae bacterium]|nr:site-specific integrase [Microthrixaceae bacterium]
MRRETNSAGIAYSGGRPRWEVRLRRPDGRQYGRTFTTRKAAEAWHRDQLTAQQNGTWIDPSAGRVDLATASTRFLTERSRPLAPKTLELYDDLLERFILPEWGGTRLTSITTEGIRSWLAAVSSAGGELQAAKAYRLLRAILNVAVSDGALLRNPCTIRGAGQERSAERPLVTPEQLVALAEAIEPHLRAFVLLAGFGGLRRGELLALRRDDIDLIGGTVRVDKQFVKLRASGMVETKPKSAAGTRTVSLPSFVVEALELHLDAFVRPEPTSAVFIGPKGRPLSVASLYPAYERARASVGIEGVTIHDLRHAAGTLAAWTGATTKELMVRMGHSTMAASIRYQHAAR